ncbi:MAG TPA: type II toxin-antitoxin system PemK/MazF family toxin [Thermoanaerobaculia bacterium]|jgi:mRNA interferase MazF|nr:type II toxin-antitoxin system PemK/MazF family toxin [Thermoanaerobaculia bacterium]
MVVSQGEIWWADLEEPRGSGAGFARPVIIVQGEVLNRSRIATVIVVPLTTNLAWAEAPGNVLLPARTSGLPRDSVANVSQILAIDKKLLRDRVGRLPQAKTDLIVNGIDLVLGR